MQITAVANRITTAAHDYAVQLQKTAQQIVVDDWRLRNWIADSNAPAWSLPTATYQSTPFSGSGDMILKIGATVNYDQATNYDYPLSYDGGGVYWDFGLQDLGNNTPVTLPDGVSTVVPYVTSVSMGGNKDLVCFYANRFRAGYKSGIYVVRVIDDGSGHVYWSEPTEVFGSVAIDDFNYQSQFFVTLPILKVINNEYWIFALECSKEVNILTYHLCYFRSTDGIHWTDREYLAGVSNDASESTVGINKHDTNTAFVLNDLKNAYLTVSGNTVYLSSEAGSKFSCPATSLVGVSNPTRQVDITGDVPVFTVSLPATPSAVQASYQLPNPYQKYNNSDVLVAGARIVHKGGYVTPNGAEVVTIVTGLIDEIRQSTELGKNELSLTVSDMSAWMRDWTADMYWEYFSPFQSTYDMFCDLTAISVINGRFYIGLEGTGSELVAATLDPNSITHESMGYINQRRQSDGSLEFRFKFTGSISNKVSVAAVIQGVSDRQFFALTYNYATTQWILYSATPSTNSKKLYNYTPVYYGTTQSLSADTWYWGKIQQWHNHVMFFTSADRNTWTKRMDFRAPVSSPAAITSNLGYWGLLGHSNSTQSGALGNIDASSGALPMYSGANPQFFAIKVTPSANGTVIALAGLFSQTDSPPALTIGLVADNNGKPADVTNADNVLYSTSSDPINYSSADSPFWRAVPTPPYVRVNGGTSYWIYWTFNGALTGNQTWEWYTGGSTATYTSPDGVGWSLHSGHGAACMFVEYDDGLVKFDSLYFTGGEVPKTTDFIANDIAVKSGIMTFAPDNFVSSSELVSGWQPGANGVLGDFVMEADVDATSAAAEIYFRATTNTDKTTGVVVNLNPSNQTITFSYNNATIQTIESMQYIPAGTFRLTLANYNRFVYVYINECLAATCFNSSFNVPGYFGVGIAPTYAAVTNLRIPDMISIKPYFVVESGKSGQSALGDLATRNRYKMFMRYDGALRMGSFLRRSSVDTYYQTVTSANRVTTSRYSVNQLLPQGDYYAMRFDAEELDNAGRRHFKKEDYTDAVSNESAYIAGSNALLHGKESVSQYSLSSQAVYPAEREDRITVVNPLDGVSQDYIISTIDWQYDFESALTTQKLGLRLFVE